MAQFEALSPDVEVNGQTVLAIVDGMGVFKDRAMKILADCGIPDPTPDGWYPQQAWLDAFRQIHATTGANTLFVIGTKIPENAQFPPEIDSIEKALASIDVAYHMNHRGGEIGHYTYTQAGPTNGSMVCNNPYPCDFDRGIVDAMAKTFSAPDQHVRVSHDPSGPCRNKGGDSCGYLITW